MAQRHKYVTVKATDWFDWVRSPLEERKYLLKFIFSFFRRWVDAKRGAEPSLNTQCLQN